MIYYKPAAQHLFGEGSGSQILHELGRRTAESLVAETRGELLTAKY
jgi:hypothetical protein